MSVFKRKTLIRLTRFMLCSYMMMYYMSFTVCAAENPVADIMAAKAVRMVYQTNEATALGTPEETIDKKTINMTDTTGVSNDTHEAIVEPIGNGSSTGIATTGQTYDQNATDLRKNTTISVTFSVSTRTFTATVEDNAKGNISLILNDSSYVNQIENGTTTFFAGYDNDIPADFCMIYSGDENYTPCKTIDYDVVDFPVISTGFSTSTLLLSCLVSATSWISLPSLPISV